MTTLGKSWKVVGRKNPERVKYPHHNNRKFCPGCGQNVSLTNFHNNHL